MEYALSNQSNDFFIKAAFKRYLLPSMLSILGYTLSLLINTIIVGNVLGDQALAAMNIVNPIYLFFSTLGSLINVGGAVGASYFIGKDDRQGCNNLFTISFILTLLTGIISSIIGLIYLEQLLMLLGVNEALYQLAYDYALVMVLGGTSVALLYFPFNFLRIDGRPALSVVMFFLMAFSNIILDLYFIISLNMGMLGVALATIISTCIAVLVGCLFLATKQGTLNLVRPKALLASIWEIVQLGSVMALNNFITIVRTIVINRILFSFFGGTSVTIFAILVTINNFSLSIISGVSQTITPLIGVFYGEKDNTSIRHTLKLAFITGTILITVFSAFISIFARPIGMLFGISQDGLLDKVVLALIFFSISLLFAMINNVFIFHFFTSGHVAIANILTTARGLVFVVLFVGILSIFNQENFVWLGFAFAEIATILLLLVIVRRVSNKNHSLSKFYLLDQTYEQNGRYISFSIANDKNEIVDASIKINSFCKENNLNAKVSMMISLALEEMLLSISDHCFKNGEKQYIDIRIFVDEEEIILRMRNGGLLFDPITYYEKKSKALEQDWMNDDSMGIGLIVRNAADISFSRTFGVNNLTIKLHK